MIRLQIDHATPEETNLLRQFVFNMIKNVEENPEKDFYRVIAECKNSSNYDVSEIIRAIRHLFNSFLRANYSTVNINRLLQNSNGYSIEYTEEDMLNMSRRLLILTSTISVASLTKFNSVVYSPKLNRALVTYTYEDI